MSPRRATRKSWCAIGQPAVATGSAFHSAFAPETRRWPGLCSVRSSPRVSSFARRYASRCDIAFCTAIPIRTDAPSCLSRALPEEPRRANATAFGFSPVAAGRTSSPSSSRIGGPLPAAGGTSSSLDPDRIGGGGIRPTDIQFLRRQRLGRAPRRGSAPTCRRRDEERRATPAAQPRRPRARIDPNLAYTPTRPAHIAVASISASSGGRSMPARKRRIASVATKKAISPPQIQTTPVIAR